MSIVVVLFAFSFIDTDTWLDIYKSIVIVKLFAIDRFRIFVRLFSGLIYLFVVVNGLRAFA